MKVRFKQDYDHRWPSRAVTAYKAGWEGTVRREVGEAAISKGKATEAGKPAKPSSDAAPAQNADLGRSRGMAEPDDAHNVGPIVRSAVVDGAGQ